MNKGKARRLVEEMRSGLLQAQKATSEFIKGSGWTVLGHETFEKFWVEEMEDITLAAELRAPVVFALFDEGIMPEQVADMVKGVGQRTADRWKQEHDAGAPADQASRRGRGKPPAPLPYETLFLHLARPLARKLRTISAAHNLRPEQLAVAAVEATVAAMETETTKAKV